MKRRRSLQALMTLIIGCLMAGTTTAHVDETGAARIESSTLKLGTSNGYYQYWLSYHLRGSRHDRYATHFFRIEYASNNLGPWHVYRRLDKHYGQSYPMPLHRWYRVRAGGLPCLLDACAYSLTSQMHWIPAERCGGATPLPE